MPTWNLRLVQCVPRKARDTCEILQLVCVPPSHHYPPFSTLRVHPPWPTPPPPSPSQRQTPSFRKPTTPSRPTATSHPPLIGFLSTSSPTSKRITSPNTRTHRSSKTTTELLHQTVHHLVEVRTRREEHVHPREMVIVCHMGMGAGLRLKGMRSRFSFARERLS